MEDIVAKFSLSENDNIGAIFKIDAAGTTWGSIDGTLSNQKDLQAALDLKADKLTVESDLETINNTITENYSTLDTKIESVNSNLSSDITTLSSTVSVNNTAVNNRIDTLEASTDADILELNTHLSDLAETVEDNYAALNTAIQNEATTRANNDTLLQNSINLLESNLSSEISNRTTADNTLQGNINTLSQTVGNNYTNLDSKITILSNTVDNNNTAINNKVDGIDTTLTGSISSLSSTVLSNYTTLDNKIDTTKTALDGDISDLTDTVTQNYTDLNSAITNSASTINSRIDDEVSTLNTSISAEETARVNADNNLQSQIDAITAASDSTFVPQTRTINNKPLSNNITLTASDVNALSDTTVIGDGVLTLQINGENVDNFNANASTNKTINLTVPTDTSDLTNNAGYITGINQADVLDALGFTPYNASNPDSFITSADLPTNYVTTDTVQNITAEKTFIGNKLLKFKGVNSSSKLGFTAYDSNNNEIGYLEGAGNGYSAHTFRLGIYDRTNSNYDNKLGFEYYKIKGSDGTLHWYNLLCPPLYPSSTEQDFYIPMSVTNGTVTVNADNKGSVDISTLLPDVSNFVTNSSLSTTLADYQPLLESGTNIKTINGNSLLGSGNITISGGGITVDQTFDGTSTNAQSGVAIEGKLNNYATLNDLSTGLLDKQDTLVSGTNIKTLNGISLLGGGDIEISSAPDIDETTITLNSEDELQAEGVIDQNTGIVKTWTGTQAEYDALPLVWTPAVQNSELGSNNWYALAYDGSKFVALSYSGYISTSVDGETWAEAVQNSELGSNEWSALAYGGDKFVALGFRCYSSLSFDGTAWTTAIELNYIKSKGWQSIAYDGSKFVALSDVGSISTTTTIDGETTWIPEVEISELGFNNWYALAYDGSKFVALGWYGSISTSTDGTTWTEAVQNSKLGSHNWAALAYDGSKFVALSNSGHISTSTDGTTWTPAVQNSELGSHNWYALAYDGSKFVALSYSGYISTSLGNSDKNTIYICTDTGNIYKGDTLINNPSSKVSTSDIWFDSTSSTLYIGVPQS